VYPSAKLTHADDTGGDPAADEDVGDKDNDDAGDDDCQLLQVDGTGMSPR